MKRSSERLCRWTGPMIKEFCDFFCSFANMFVFDHSIKESVSVLSCDEMLEIHISYGSIHRFILRFGGCCCDCIVILFRMSCMWSGICSECMSCHVVRNELKKTIGGATSWSRKGTPSSMESNTNDYNCESVSFSNHPIDFPRKIVELFVDKVDDEWKQYIDGICFWDPVSNECNSVFKVTMPTCCV